MLQLLEKLLDKEQTGAACFGIEHEALRVDGQGALAVSKHPAVFGDKLKHPYITTDFSESQVEMITPCFTSVQETYDFLNALYDITVLNIGEEWLWPSSSPCHIPEDDKIPIASYGASEEGQQAHKYRESLLKKYGGKKQLISGIHYNFSFQEVFMQKLYHQTANVKDFKTFKDEVYLKVTRNYLRYRWLIIYLLGASPVLHESFMSHETKDLEKITADGYSNEGAVSYRNSKYGYRNQTEFYPDYTSVAAYIASIQELVRTKHIQSHKELYSQIRLKAGQNRDLLNALSKDGIQYLEIRSIDKNPFEKGGISLQDLDFLHVFMIYMLVKEESTYLDWQQEAAANQLAIAHDGLSEIELYNDGQKVLKTKWALEILEEMLRMDERLQLGKAAVIEQMIEKVKDPSKTYAARMKVLCQREGYLKANLNLAKLYKETAYNQRYKFQGFEGMELSTQILMKEAVLKGIQVEVLDPLDNFIALKQEDHIEYVKQATKTSKDSYMTMLIMENKTVTKKVLEKAKINVPQGIEVFKGQNYEYAARQYEGKPIVVKPKSTNFGTGISIFPEGGEMGDIIKALEIGFQYDDTVLIETFAKGKEYRFLVIGDETAGILHRVPANVTGDGIKTITELVAIKNQDSLRGKGYKTPLEKINLDESSRLFLKQSHRDFDYIPKAGEIVYLRENSNISTGGDSIDYTDEMPQRFKDIAVQAAKAVGAKFCGVDMMLEDYQNPESPYAIIELNFNPAIHIHSYPYKGKERKIANKVLKVLGFNS